MSRQQDEQGVVLTAYTSNTEAVLRAKEEQTEFLGARWDRINLLLRAVCTIYGNCILGLCLKPSEVGVTYLRHHAA